jgi:hypothetical protein
MSNEELRDTSYVDKNGRCLFEKDWIALSCSCCFYQIIWDEEKKCWWPNDDGFSQVHEKDINVWESEFEYVLMEDPSHG